MTNLCDTCKHNFTTCTATSPDTITFESVTSDAVVECKMYKERRTKHGFDYDGSGRIPDTLLLELSPREYYRRVSTKTVEEYAQYKLVKLELLIKESIVNGLSALSYNAGLRLTHRIKAVSSVQSEIGTIEKCKDK